MTRTASLAAALLVGMPAALASPCSEGIDALAKRVEAQGQAAIAASSGGQADAAARGAQGQTGASGQAGAAPPEKAAEAGKGADAAQAAKVALDEARTADGKGDAKGCAAALDRAKSSLDAAP